MADKYEAGRKKHMAWHKAQGDPWTWNVYEITTGPDTGGYIIVSPDHQWADLDTWTAKFGDGDTADADVVDGRHAGVVADVLLDAVELVEPPAPGRSPPTPLVSLTIYSVKPGHDGALMAAIGKLNAALTAAKYPLHSIWYRLINGGATPAYAVVTPRANMATFSNVVLASVRKAAGQGRLGGAGRRSSSTTSPASRPSCCSGAPISATRPTKELQIADCRLQIERNRADVARHLRQFRNLQSAICNLQSAIDLFTITSLVARPA